MARALVILVLAMRVAAANPTFAVDIRSNDVSSDKLAPALEEALRATKSRYANKGTHADRVKAQVDACDYRAKECAVDIGKRLGVDYMLSGSVERHGANFLLTLDVFDVAQAKRVRSVRELAPLNTTGKAWAKTVIARVADAATANVVVRCNVHHAMVFVDGVQVTELYDGTATLLAIGLGRHLLELKANGYKTYSDDVVIDADETINVLMDAK